MKLLLFVTVWILGSVQALAAAPSVAAPEISCQIDKSSRLAMDQRDNQRLSCLKQKSRQLNVDQCLTIANSLEYSNNAEEARQVCLYDLKKKVSFNDCSKVARAMEYADTGDEVRWECLRRDSGKISKSQCRHLAKRMAYPANQERAELFCEDELR